MLQRSYSVRWRLDHHQQCHRSGRNVLGDHWGLYAVVSSERTPSLGHGAQSAQVHRVYSHAGHCCWIDLFHAVSHHHRAAVQVDILPCLSSIDELCCPCAVNSHAPTPMTGQRRLWMHTATSALLCTAGKGIIYSEALFLYVFSSTTCYLHQRLVFSFWRAPTAMMISAGGNRSFC